MQGPSDDDWNNPPIAPGRIFNDKILEDGSRLREAQEVKGLIIWMVNEKIEKAKIGDLKVSAWDKDSITVNGCNCKFAEDDKNLVCPDHAYEAAETPKTIMISKDGTTREHAGK